MSSFYSSYSYSEGKNTCDEDDVCDKSICNNDVGCNIKNINNRYNNNQKSVINKRNKTSNTNYKEYTKNNKISTSYKSNKLAGCINLAGRYHVESFVECEKLEPLYFI